MTQQSRLGRSSSALQNQIGSPQIPLIIIWNLRHRQWISSSSVKARQCGIIKSGRGSPSATAVPKERMASSGPGTQRPGETGGSGNGRYQHTTFGRRGRSDYWNDPLDVCRQGESNFVCR
uniref:Uncharacterized protein n=1 Tax=Cacopsylla melanoneura TaxID=428564 RepID=A0A8D8LXN8_9HEMI